VLGEDLTQTGARAALAVRQAVKGKAREMAAAQKVADWQIAAILNIGQRAKHPLFVTNVDNTRLDDIAAWTYCAPVEDQARLALPLHTRWTTTHRPLNWIATCKTRLT
jgi:NADH-quinone oxidoreductase subunit G